MSDSNTSSTATATASATASARNEDNNLITKKQEQIVLPCPHCQDCILIEQLNCRIFRHAVLKATNTQINPHASQEECEQFIQKDLIYGCGKPFKVIDTDDGQLRAVICDYI